VVWCADWLLENKVHSLKLLLLKIGIYLQARHIDRHVVVYCEEFIDPFTTCSDTGFGDIVGSPFGFERWKRLRTGAVVDENFYGPSPLDHICLYRNMA